MKIKKVLITGSSGFVGTRLVEALSSKIKDISILGIDRVESSVEITKSKNFQFYQADLAEKGWVYRLDFHADLIIHCAAAKGDFGISKNEYMRDNITATAAVIAYSEIVNCNKIIYYSTVSAYGHKDKICYEDDSFDPDGPYGETKYQGELILNKWLEEAEDRQLSVLRPSVIYGENNYANMYNLLYSLDRLFPISIGRGKHIKSIISVKNMVNINLHILYILPELPKYSAFICVDAPYLTLNEIMQTMAEVKGINMPLIRIPIFLAYFLAIPFEIVSQLTGKDMKVTFDRIQKLNTSTDYRSNLLQETGYIQKFSTKEELRKMALWYKNI